jgi:transcriptional regulator with XRE-family HTH domain
MATIKKKPHPRSVDKSDKLRGERIRMLRIVAGLSQADLGEKLGVSFQQVQKYEKGKNRLSSGRLEQVSKALGCSMMEIMEGKEGMQNNESTPFSRFMASREGVQIVEAMVAINDPSVRKSIINLAESLRS